MLLAVFGGQRAIQGVFFVQGASPEGSHPLGLQAGSGCHLQLGRSKSRCARLAGELTRG